MTVHITPQMIKELRDITGVGIGKCKEALEKSGGSIEEAVSILRKAGMASAVKKEGRAANEGMIAAAQTADVVVIVEVNAETDFVVKNERFQGFTNEIAEEIAKTKPTNLEAFLKQKYSKDGAMTIDEYRATVIQAIGENIQIKRFKVFPKGANRSIGTYCHLGGKIVTVVEISGSNSEVELAGNIAMHVAAASPEYVAPEDVPENILTNEKDIARSQVTGKPEFVIDKIVEGKISKFYDDFCLNCQLYIKDDKMKIGALVEKRGKEIGAPLKIESFTRWTVGES